MIGTYSREAPSPPEPNHDGIGVDALLAVHREPQGVRAVGEGHARRDRVHGLEMGPVGRDDVGESGAEVHVPAAILDARRVLAFP